MKSNTTVSRYADFRGATFIEYVVLLAFIVVLTIGGVKLFAGQVEGSVGTSATRLDSAY